MKSNTIDLEEKYTLEDLYDLSPEELSLEELNISFTHTEYARSDIFNKLMKATIRSQSIKNDIKHFLEAQDFDQILKETDISSVLDSIDQFDKFDDKDTICKNSYGKFVIGGLVSQADNIVRMYHLAVASDQKEIAEILQNKIILKIKSTLPTIRHSHYFSSYLRGAVKLAKACGVFDNLKEFFVKEVVNILKENSDYLDTHQNNHLRYFLRELNEYQLLNNTIATTIQTLLKNPRFIRSKNLPIINAYIHRGLLSSHHIEVKNTNILTDKNMEDKNNSVLSEKNTEAKNNSILSDKNTEDKNNSVLSEKNTEAKNNSILGDKIKVFIPVFIPKDKTEAKRLSREINESELNTKSFDDIALIINENIQHYYTQVGYDAYQASEAVDQHSWYKHYKGYVLIEAMVDKNMIKNMAESDLCSVNRLNAGSEKFPTLQPNSYVHKRDIIGICNRGLPSDFIARKNPGFKNNTGTKYVNIFQVMQSDLTIEQIMHPTEKDLQKLIKGVHKHGLIHFKKDVVSDAISVWAVNSDSPVFIVEHKANINYLRKYADAYGRKCYSYEKSIQPRDIQRIYPRTCDFFSEMIKNPGFSDTFTKHCKMGIPNPLLSIKAASIFNTKSQDELESKNNLHINVTKIQS